MSIFYGNPILEHDQADEQQRLEETAAAWLDEHLPAGIASQQAHKRTRQQLGDTNLSAAVYDVLVARATGSQRRQPRAGPETGIEL